MFTAVDRHSHSATDTLYGIFPYFACTFLLVDWIARRPAATLSKPAVPAGKLGDARFAAE